MEKNFNADDLKKVIYAFKLERELNCELVQLFKRCREYERLKFGEIRLPVGTMFSFKRTKRAKRETVWVYTELDEMRFTFSLEFMENGTDSFFGVVPLIEFDAKGSRMRVQADNVKGFAPKLPILYYREPQHWDGVEGLYFANPEAFLLVKRQIEKMQPEVEAVCEGMRSLMHFNEE